MSRIFEFIQKVSQGTGEALLDVPPLRENGTASPGAGQILSVLKIPGADGEPIPAPAGSQLQHVPVRHADTREESRLAVYSDPGGPAADRFRFLRMRLRERAATGKLKTLLITSPLPQDGKSTVVMNLATALAERGERKVLVIDADLHHASVAPRLGIEGGAGVTECLLGDTHPLSAICRIEPLGWYLLATHEKPEHPTELLQTESFSDLIKKLAPLFDWILVDSPPVLPLTDAVSLGQRLDGTLLVARAGVTPKRAVKDTIALLGRNHVVGVVLNGVEEMNQVYSRYRGYYKAS